MLCLSQRKAIRGGLMQFGSCKLCPVNKIINKRSADSRLPGKENAGSAIDFFSCLRSSID